VGPEVDFSTGYTFLLSLQKSLSKIVKQTTWRNTNFGWQGQSAQNWYYLLAYIQGAICLTDGTFFYRSSKSISTTAVVGCA